MLRAALGSLTEDTAANSAIDALNALCPTWLAIYSASARRRRPCSEGLLRQISSRLGEGSIGLREVHKCRCGRECSGRGLWMEFLGGDLNSQNAVVRKNLPGD